MTRNQKLVMACFALVWAWAAIAPVSRTDWLIENIPIFAVFLFLLYKRFSIQISDVSFAMIALFMALHVMGAHYTYEQVPFGHTLQEWLGSSRNMYDRLVHFSFGFLLLRPIHEVFFSTNNFRRTWGYYFSMTTILALAGLYEIFEWVVSAMVTPILSITFLGSQGDLWDTQKDMTMALFGAVLMSTVLAFVYARRQHRVNI